MIDRNYQTYEERMAAEKIDRERRYSIGKGLFTIILALIILWFIFGFLGSFFTKSSEHTSHYNKTESNQTITDPKKGLHSTPSLPYTYKDTTSTLPYKYNPSDKIPSSERN
ncbi:hypothetical protein [Bartonella raoultii]|uniref:Uncharacterized protein n=1 Tax=Bartonella raoultii TaxID=1457020 RepID=A0ABS7I4D7_9HYPH|nr:hypothetical protein [Bartonella raoultii]MBX4335535.1 hypothetical protein [Bartonella raoultii]